MNAGNASVFDMIGALKKMMQRNQWKEPQDTVIERTEIPIEKRMDEVLQQVKGSKNGIAFYALFPVPTKSYIVSTFVAVLELMKKEKYMQCKKIILKNYMFIAWRSHRGIRLFKRGCGRPVICRR